MKKISYIAFLAGLEGAVEGFLSSTQSLRTISTSRMAESSRSRSVIRLARKDDSPEQSESLGLKAAWLGTELLGRVAGTFRDKAGSNGDAVNDGPPQSLEEASVRLREDYERDYFVSGLVDRELYAPECYFSDPFAGFAGRERFISNLQNLGTFITGAELRMLKYEEDLGASPPVITTKLMVKLQLNLPWQPVLAWPWGVRHEFDVTSNQIIDHHESWDVSAMQGLQQVFRPASPALLKRLKEKS